MQFAVKLIVSVIIIVVCSQIGRAFPSLSGLIATMPLTSLVVLMWLWTDNSGDYAVMVRYSRGALWGIVPSILLFVVTSVCFKKQLPFVMVLGAGFGVYGFWAPVCISGCCGS